MNNKTIEIDLNNFHPASELIGEFTVNRIIVKNIFIKKEVDAVFERIEITDISIPTSIYLDKPDSFLTIKCHKLGLPPLRSHTNVPVQVDDLKFSIEADIKKIQNIILGLTDNKDSVQEIPINFAVSQRCAQYNIDLKEAYSLKLLVKPYHAQVRMEYVPSIEEFEFEENKNVPIGNLNFIINKVYGFFYIEDFQVSLRVKGEIDQRAVKADLIKVSERLKPETTLSVPVFCDTTYLPGNPDKRLSLAAEVDINGRDYLWPPENINVEILSDSTQTKLQVEIVDEDLLSDNTSYSLKHKVVWRGNRRKGRMACFETRISNLAQSGDGIIKVRNLTMIPHYESDQIELQGEREAFFELDGPSEFDLENRQPSAIKHKLAFQHTSIKRLNVQALKVEANLQFEYAITRASESEEQEISELYFCTHCYQDLQRHIVTLNPSNDKLCPSCGRNETTFLKLTSGYDEFLPLLNSYLEDAATDHPNKLQWTPFQARIIFTLEEFTGNTWLAVDFGTSASVVALADANTLQIQSNSDIFINMNEALQNLYGQKFHEYSFGENGDTNIISSEILLRTSKDSERSYLESTDYHEDVVHISPPKEILTESSAFSLPYLKSLIGFDTVPDINGTYKKLKYYLNKKQDQPVSFEQRPLSVQEILKNVYNSFLRDFIKPQVNGQVTDKIIFGVPNTFSPKQVQIIRQIIDKHFPDFRSEYISFISESDAVACEYMANWMEHNAERADRDQIIKQDEHVLVYDVGAGTLDLTLFKISSLTAKGKRELKILGKLGKGTAGNYLDYVIARIIDNISKNPEKMTETTGFEPVAYFNKDFIKSFIKPRLNQPDLTFYITRDGNLKSELDPDAEEIYIGAILDHPLMEEYLVANSTDVIEQFFNLFSGTDESVSAVPKESRIHTIIFSGRGVLFDQLRDRFEQALRAFISDDYTPHIIFNSDPEKLKSVVVKGALNYAVEFRNTDYSSVEMISRNLMARYGFLYRNPGNSRWEFLEVLNPSTSSLNFMPHRVYGLSIFEYDTDRKNAQGDPAKMTIDLSRTAVCYFVQSYSTDTARDFNNRNWDYITIMYSFEKSNIVNTGNIRAVPVRVQIDRENQMSVTVGREENDYASTVKVNFSNVTFKKSLWPYV